MAHWTQTMTPSEKEAWKAKCRRVAKTRCATIKRQTTQPRKERKSEEALDLVSALEQSGIANEATLAFIKEFQAAMN